MLRSKPHHKGVPLFMMTNVLLLFITTTLILISFCHGSSFYGGHLTYDARDDNNGYVGRSSSLPSHWYSACIITLLCLSQVVIKLRLEWLVYRERDIRLCESGSIDISELEVVIDSDLTFNSTQLPCFIDRYRGILMVQKNFVQLLDVSSHQSSEIRWEDRPCPNRSTHIYHPKTEVPTEYVVTAKRKTLRPQ